MKNDVTYLLLDWYERNKRDLPWRNSYDAYYIWLSEIILQQTRVAQGTDYYLKFIRNFPSIYDLAAAPMDDVLKLWQGLGYYTRARNMHITAKQIVNQYGGKFPSSYAGLIQMKGIGDYTAAAIASISYNEAVPVVDGNVMRFVTRFYGIHEDITKNSTRSTIKNIVHSLLPKSSPGTFNQAVMEFGAIHCIPRNPDCAGCIYSSKCYAYLNNAVHALPVKKKKNIVNMRYFHYLVPIYHEYTYITQRGKGDIWTGLYEFPLVELKENITPEEFIQHRLFDKIYSNGDLVISHISGVIKHVLTHQIIYAQFYVVKIKNALNDNYMKIRLTDIEKYPVSRLIEKFLEEYSFR